MTAGRSWFHCSSLLILLALFAALIAGMLLLTALGCAGAGEVVKFYEDYLFDVGVGPAPFQDDIIEQFELVLGENFSGEFPGFNPHSAHGEDQTGSAIAKMLLGPVFID